MANFPHKQPLIAVTVTLVSLLAWLSYAGAGVSRSARRWQLPVAEKLFALPPDTINQDSLQRAREAALARALADSLRRNQLDPSQQALEDSLRNIPYVKSRRPKPKMDDRYGDPFADPGSRTPLYLDNPKNVNLDVQLGDSLKRFEIKEKAGSIDYRPPVYMTYEEYSRFQQQQAMRSYWRSKSAGLDGESEVASKRIIPKIHVGQGIDRIFGGNYVDIRPNGNVTLRAGARFNYTENPNIPVRMRRTGDFDFDQSIALNLVGKVGEKLKLTVNYDTKANFDFENNLKLEYTGYDEEIIRKIEAGNVSLPINGTLIRGAQNLFGVKTQMQFGRLSVTSIISNQRGSNDAVEVNDGAQVRPFEIRADEYDENRHYFLSDFFRDNYNRALARLPFINSGVMIRRIEVYVTNTNNRSTEGLRNIVGFMDLGEPDPFRPQFENGGNDEPSNTKNRLYNILTSAGPSARNVDNVDNFLLNNSQLQAGTFQRAKDFERVNNARKLNEREFRFNERLGYISLNTALQPQEVLAVAFEYTLQGKTYKVGELIDDYQNLGSQDVIYLKLLKATQPNLELPTWDLMMKNVYSLNASQVNQENFMLDIVYKDDETGVNLTALKEGPQGIADVPLVDVMNLDNVGPNNDPPGDGNFDYIEGLTIDSEYGRIYFPEIEPFGSNLRTKFAGDAGLEEKYVFQKLYDVTKNEARQYASENKFFLVGEFQATSSDEIRLPGIRIARGSVAVYAGGTRLTENVDYSVNYDLGTVKILNQGYANSGQDIRVDYEKADMLTLQPRTLLGARLDYVVNKDITFGATILSLNERTYIQRVQLGDEPTNNTIYGVDFNLQKESRFLTRMVDKIPGISTKAPSTITVSGEYAQLLPGKSKLDGIEDGTSYIDDFEGAKIPNMLTNQFQGNAWRIASTPQRFLAVDPNSGASTLENGFNRGRISWYTIDPVFFTNSRPGDISDEDMKNHYVRPVRRQEVFPFRSNAANTSYDNTFDIAYFPDERGQYNYRTESLQPDGRLRNPTENWAGISRGITYDTDFENANVQFLEFWLMDPFLKTTNPGSNHSNIVDGEYQDDPNTSGGELFFNLGNVSEDVLMDNRNAFENGLPSEGDPNSLNLNDPNVVFTEWGRVTKLQNINDAFDNTTGARDRQDVGLDGLSSGLEDDYFTEFVNDPALAAQITDPAALAAIQNDPSSDNFRHFLDGDFGGTPAPLLRRYKKVNNMEGNSSLSSSRAFTSLPDKEDLNSDNTISNLESYWEYQISLRPNRMQVGQNYIIDKTTTNVHGDEVTWYQFRIPIREAAAVAYGGITDFRSIRFIRMYMAGFAEPVVLRFMQFQFVANQWREFPETLGSCGPALGEDPVNQFTIGTVNIEENGAGGAGSIPYVLPPGINRQENLATINNQLQNEQSLQLCVDNLLDQYAKAVTKTITMDMLIYKQLKLFLHAEGSETLKDGDLNAMVRIGTDNTKNYYELIVPLKVTPPGSTQPIDIWPAENTIDLPFQMFVDAKVARNAQQSPVDLVTPWSFQVPGRPGWVINVVGNPDFSDVRTMLVGVQNPCDSDKSPESGCIWVNELRVTDFDKTAGWAATGRVNAQLADFANVVATGSYTAVGFGGLEDRIQQRARENTSQVDVAANVTLDKFLPTTSGIKVPMSVGYGSTVIEPRYDPLQGDVELDQVLDNIESSSERRQYREQVISRETRRNINFMNVRKERMDPKDKPQIYDIENFSISYAYNDILSHDPTTKRYFQKNHRGGIAYTYAPTPPSYAPFSKVAAFDSPYLKLIKDLNFSPLPNNVSVRFDLDRSYSERFRQRLVPFSKQFVQAGAPTFIKSFYFTRIYDLKWNLTKSLTFDYTANNRSIIDEPEGAPTKEGNTIIWNNLKNGGRNTNFNQTAALTYRLPLDKLPITNWLSADVRYAANYTWRANSLALTRDTTLGNLGNIIENNAEKSVNGRIDMVKLYDKVRFLKDINNPAPAPKPGVKPATAKPATPAPAGAQPKDSTEKPVRELKALKSVLRALMTMRSVNFTYSLTEGTQLPGYLPTTKFLGFDEGFEAPGLPFIIGRQYDLDQLYGMAARNGWYTDSSQFLTEPLRSMRTENISARTSLEPFKAFNIQLDAKLTRSRADEVFYRFNQDTEIVERQSPVELGDYNVSFIAVNTFFESGGSGANPKSDAFEQLIVNRQIVKDQLDAANPNPGTYGLNSQEVLIPSFIYAYKGQSMNGFTAKKADPFKVFPLPNWRIDYAGLSNLDFFKKHFSSISLTHSYSSVYSVPNYISSLLYENDPGRYSTVTNASGEFVPYRIVGQVMITERFAPLIGVNVRTKNNLTIRLEYKQERNLSLDLTNAQVTETGVKDYVLGLGYITKNFRVPFKIRGERKVLKNDLTARMDFTIRDNKTILRRIEENRSTNTFTNGAMMLQIKPTIDYVVNRRLNLQFYFTRTINAPKVSNAFLNTRTEGGIQLRYNLTP